MFASDSPKPARRWMQFRLSTVLGLVLLCALAAIWQRDRMEIRRLEERLAEMEQANQARAEQLRELGVQVERLGARQRPSTYRDKNGVLRALDGRPVGQWGVDGRNMPAQMAPVR